jgi:hypothetical protein
MGMGKKVISFQYTTKSGRVTSPQFNIRHVPEECADVIERGLIGDARTWGGTLRIATAPENPSSVGAFRIEQRRWDTIFRKEGKKKA